MFQISHGNAHFRGGHVLAHSNILPDKCIAHCSPAAKDECDYPTPAENECICHHGGAAFCQITLDTCYLCNYYAKIWQHLMAQQPPNKGPAALIGSYDISHFLQAEYVTDIITLLLWKQGTNILQKSVDNKHCIVTLASLTTVYEDQVSTELFVQCVHR